MSGIFLGALDTTGQTCTITLCALTGCWKQGQGCALQMGPHKSPCGPSTFAVAGTAAWYNSDA